MSRRLVLWDVVTLDGYFEGAERWDVTFMEKAWGPELEAFSIAQSREVDTLLFGRVTYQGMRDYWTEAEGEIADFMNGVPKVVFSRTLTEADWANTRLVRAEAVDEVRRLKAEPGGGDGELFVFGSADLSASLLDAGLVDELRLGIVPLVLGNGTPFFKLSDTSLDFEHIDTRQLGPGCTLLRYRPVVG